MAFYVTAGEELAHGYLAAHIPPLSAPQMALVPPSVASLGGLMRHGAEVLDHSRTQGILPGEKRASHLVSNKCTPGQSICPGLGPEGATTYGYVLRRYLGIFRHPWLDLIGSNTSRPSSFGSVRMSILFHLILDAFCAA